MLSLCLSGSLLVVADGFCLGVVCLVVVGLLWFGCLLGCLDLFVL
jgi:hypothetical protein